MQYPFNVLTKGECQMKLTTDLFIQEAVGAAFSQLSILINQCIFIYSKADRKFVSYQLFKIYVSAINLFNTAF